MTRTVWYPGHMEKGKRQLKEMASQVDVFIEVRDARAPKSTSSPFVQELAKLKPVCVVLSKRDLAEEDKTRLWIKELASSGAPAFALNLKRGVSGELRRKLFEVCEGKPRWRELRVAIVGIPNVGKSMLLNALIGKKTSKVGGLPGITRGVSWHKAGRLLVVDSPGILDPKTDRETRAMLAWLGCIRISVVGDYESLSLEFLKFMQSSSFISRILEKLGLVKMDFLGLRTLSMMEETLSNISRNGKKTPDITRLPMDDKLTFEMLKKGDTMGVFQLESSGMRQLLKKLSPDSFQDIIAVLALYRPGPLGSGMVDQYIERKRGRSPVTYPHPALEDVLKETYGIILYQEQVMQIAAELAGYSLGQADILRRAMGKKKVEEMEEQRKVFLKGCLANSVSAEKANEIFDLIEYFAGYGFNKSHSAAYAMISYQTAYLKAHYPVEFLAAFLSSHIGAKKEILARYVRNVRAAGIKVLPPDVNESEAGFTAVGSVIRFGLTAVAKAGSGAVEAILKAREEGGPFKSLWDFVSRIDLRAVNRSVIESLIGVGAFDGLHNNRRQILESLPILLEMRARQEEDKYQQRLFSLEADGFFSEEPALVEVEDFEFRQKLELEKAAVGLYISGHPFEAYETRVRKYAFCTPSELVYWCSKKSPLIGGIVTEVTERYTKKGDLMGIVEIEDLEAKLEIVCFPRIWSKVKAFCQMGNVILVTGRLEERGGLTVIAEDIVSLEIAESENHQIFRLRIPFHLCNETVLRDLLRTCKSYPGKDQVLVEVYNDKFSAFILLNGTLVNTSDDLIEKIEDRIGSFLEIAV
jgi:DNA polymerase-3 subunit alpha